MTIESYVQNVRFDQRPLLQAGDSDDATLLRTGSENEIGTLYRWHFGGSEHGQ